MVTDQELPVMEAFYTLQGEGFHQGKAAYFIRLGGCDVGCHWCDVKESWDADAHAKQSVEQLAAEALAATGNQPKLAVVTGGEPLLHRLDALTTALQEKGFDTNIETSGSSPLSGRWNWICVSPKKFKAPLPEVLHAADELKVVVLNRHDLIWAQSFVPQLKTGCKLYLQPEWEKRNIVLPLIVDFIKQHPEWQLSTQVHKYIDVP